MGHKIKYGAKFFLKINFFPYLPTHFWGVMLPETNILFILALSLQLSQVFQKPMLESGTMTPQEMASVFVNWKELIQCNTKLLK